MTARGPMKYPAGRPHTQLKGKGVGRP